MSQLDRLSSLVSRFEIHARSIEDRDSANLAIELKDNEPASICIWFKSPDTERKPSASAIYATLDFGGRANPVLEALPDQISIKLEKNPDLSAVAKLIVNEIVSNRCGAQYALDRLCEFLVVSVLRKQIEEQKSQTGILAALADRNLSPVLVAIHDFPGRTWRLDDLVPLSGMSRTQFMEVFQAVVGVSPMAYLKRWRMTLARNELLSGGRVKEIARRYGYGSGDAFTRAFTATYGVAPTQLNSVEGRF